jgi:hypothetical protein
VRRAFSSVSGTGNCGAGFSPRGTSVPLVVHAKNRGAGLKPRADLSPPHFSNQHTAVSKRDVKSPQREIA